MINLLMKIVFTQKFIYVLAQDVDRELWPFKMPAPTFMKHKMVKQAPEDSKPDKRKHFDLKMMSYNVYADAFMEPTIKGSIAYSNQCSKSFEQIDFQYRSHLIMDEIDEANADIICLQEVDHYEDFYKNEIEDLGYQTIINKRSGEHDYVTLLIGFKKDKFELVKEHQIEGMKDSQFKSIYQTDMIKHCCGYICVFKEKATQQLFIVSNSHLHWNPKRDFIKFAQTLHLLEQLQTVYNEFKTDENGEIPIFSLGDFNSKPLSAPLFMMYGKALEYKVKDELAGEIQEFNQKKRAFKFSNKHIEEVQEMYKKANLRLFENGKRFVSAYDKYNSDFTFGEDGQIDLDKSYDNLIENMSKYLDIDTLLILDEFKDGEVKKTDAQKWAICNQLKHPEFSNYNYKFAANLDYIFYWLTDKVKLISLLEMPNKEQVEDGFEKGNLPNRIYGSDHVRLEACFKVYID